MAALDDDTVPQPAVRQRRARYARAVRPRRAHRAWYTVTSSGDWWKLLCVFMVGMGVEGVLTGVLFWWLR